MLKNDPTQAPNFEKVFGKGAADYYLSKLEDI